MKEEIYKCDGCGKIRGQANHWFAAHVADDLFVLVSFEESKKRPGPWEHFCGEECLLKMVARNLPK